MATAANRVFYLGDDAAYFRVLSGELKRLAPGKDISLERRFESDPVRIQTLLPKVLAENPSLVMVDFSKHTDDYVHLARLFARTNHPTPFKLVGLHDYLSPPDQILEAFLSGVPVNHVKSAELHDPAFAALLMMGHNQEHGFATADLTEEVTANHLCKIGSVDLRGLHFETNLSLEQGQEIRLHHLWRAQKVMPSGLAKVRTTSTSRLFYNFKRAVDADFAWVEPLIKSEADTPERAAELANDHEAAIAKAKKQMRAWIENNADRSESKGVRVLVVDRDHAFYKDRPRTDSYGYAIRCQPYLVDPAAELDAQRPQVVAIALDPAPEGKPQQLPGNPNDMAMVGKVVDFFRQNCGDSPPYLVVFNLPGTSSKDLQLTLSYPHSMAYDGEFGPEVLVKMAGLFAGKLKPTAKSPSTVVVKKSHPASIGEIEEQVKLLKLSETDAVFECSRPLPEGTVLRFHAPFEGFLTVVPHAQHSKAPQYYGLVNGIGEEGKKSLRRYVNGLFFKDHDAEKLAELEAYQQLNQVKLEEQMAAEQVRIAAEEAARAKKAEEEAAKAAAAAPAEAPAEEEVPLPKVSNG